MPTVSEDGVPAAAAPYLELVSTTRNTICLAWGSGPPAGHRGHHARMASTASQDSGGPTASLALSPGGSVGQQGASVSHEPRQATANALSVESQVSIT